MNLTKKQRFKFIPRIAKKVIKMGEDDGFLFLNEYTNNSKLLHEVGDNGEQYPIYFDYSKILEFIKKLDNKTTYEMYKDLFPEEVKTDFPDKPSYHLSTDKLVLFFSHSHKDLNRILKVKEILERTDWIECFIAHKDIKLSKEWEEEIKKHLECCHCLIAFISKNFKSSNYCDQEIGMAIHRNIPICPFMLDDTEIYGFIKHLQGKSFKNLEDSADQLEDLANQIEEYLLDKQEKVYQIAWPKLQKTIETLKSNFLNSTNTKMAESVLNQLMEFKTGQIDPRFITEIQENWKQNSKIQEAKGIERTMEEFFKKQTKQDSGPEKISHNEGVLKSKDQENAKNNWTKVQERGEATTLGF